MGQASNYIIVGRCCSWCGVYFKQRHEYPVVCKSCAEDDDYDEDKDPQVAIFEEI